MSQTHDPALLLERLEELRVDLQNLVKKTRGGTTMKDSMGYRLRDAWEEKGSPECSHAELSLERSFSGVTTGTYICSMCGALMLVRAFHTEATTLGKEVVRTAIP